MNPNDPAFPVSGEAAGKPYSTFSGMSARMWLAGQALPSVIRVLSDIQPETLERKQFTPEEVAEYCADYADAVIAKLNKQTKP